MEFMISFGPLFFDVKELNTLHYAIFKVPRYVRLFEIDNQIEEILDYMSSSRTVSEIDTIKRYLSILEFAISTLINLHLLTCLMIMLCLHRSDYSITWMGARDVPKDDAEHQYIIAIYFVTTTLSTCGFGDIYAQPGDGTESAVILFLQFVGMLFYSMTIQKVQSFMLTNEQLPGEYANSMVEVVENLIVKVGR